MCLTCTKSTLWLHDCQKGGPFSRVAIKKKSPSAFEGVFLRYWHSTRQMRKMTTSACIIISFFVLLRWNELFRFCSTFCVTSRADCHSNGSVGFFFFLNVSLHESYSQSFSRASASSEPLANHEGVGCSKAELRMEQVVVGGLKQPLQCSEWEKPLLCEASTAQFVIWSVMCWYVAMFW